MVGEGHVLKPRFVHVFIEGRVAAVIALEALGPAQAAIHRLFLLVRLGSLGFSQSEQHLRGVVHVGIPVVEKLEGPTAGDRSGVLHHVVPAHLHFLGQEPVRRFLHSGMIRLHPGGSQGGQGDGRVPNRAEAGLHPEIAVGGVVHFQSLQILHRLDHPGVPLPVSETAKREDGVHHGRENGRQPFGLRPCPLEDPLLRSLQRPLAERLPGKSFQKAEQLVHPDKKVFHGEEAILHRVEERTAFDPVGIELVQLFFGREMRDRAETADDGHGHDNGAGPGAHF